MFFKRHPPHFLLFLYRSVQKKSISQAEHEEAGTITTAFRRANKRSKKWGGVLRHSSAGLFLLFLLSGVAFADTIHHQLDVKIEPAQYSIEVVDQITLPDSFSGKIEFSLNPALTVKSSEASLKQLKSGQYQITLPAGKKQLQLSYQGKINDQLEAYGKEQSRGFRSTTGIISEQGVYLAASSQWYPVFSNQDRITFELSTQLPEKWQSVSQGTGTKNHWSESHPQEDIYLIAAPFHFYQQQTGKIVAQVYLREDDEKLANKYLKATDKYIQMYEKLLGEYPYGKFALVENFWETGYGMPSFTLLGSRVIRLPFILNSSYPHEILHNWWGNGVYVDYQSGNWSEGLTAYLADHLIKEQQGKGVQYRQQSLQKYSDYAARGRDFPLVEFRGRHSSATEAVGYGKALMLFHMLRQDLGDTLFTQGLQAFYQAFQFKKASYNDIQKTFEKVANKPLDAFFKQWVERTGAPALQLGKTNINETAGKHELSFELQQTQSGEVYQLNIPINIRIENSKQAHQVRLNMSQKKQTFKIALDGKPLRLDIDPEFDLFRKLAREETPPAYTRVFGSKSLLVILPRKAKDELKTGYQEFAEQMKLMGPDEVRITWDDELEALPDNQAITLIGWENKFFPEITPELNKYHVTFDKDTVTINKKVLNHKGNSLALTVRRNTLPLSFIASDLPSALPGLARKLPHYHKYSYVAFSGEEPQNTLKGRWAVTHSPMTAFLMENAPKPVLAKRAALIDPPAQFDVKKMQASIEFLSQEKLQGRGFGSKELDQAADWIAAEFKTAGLVAAGDKLDSYFQAFKAKGGEPAQETTLKNIIGFIPGSNPKFAGQSVVVGAHYDHLGLGWPDVRADNRGKIHSGADDNASGVAVLLELARYFSGNARPERTIIFVAFSGEEAGRLGSKYYVNNLRDYPADKIIGMLNLDTVGRLGKNKFLILGASSASQWQHILRGIGFVTGIQTSMVNEELDSSDQISFHEVGVPAIQLFSGANTDYHRPSDTADKMDYEGLLKATIISKEVVDYLSSRKDPLSVTLKDFKKPQSNATHPKSTRKVSLGTIPDFTWKGKGYRLDGVMPDSPVANAGLQKGDVIVKIAGKEIAGLRDISNVLKSLNVGQKISVVFLRDKKQIEKDVVLKAK